MLRPVTIWLKSCRVFRLVRTWSSMSDISMVSCQANWSVQQYYALSADLTRQFNDSGMAYFMNRLSAVLGKTARHRIKLIYKQDMLVEVQLTLAANLTLEQNLEGLIAAALIQTSTECGTSFRVDPIRQN